MNWDLTIIIKKIEEWGLQKKKKASMEALKEIFRGVLVTPKN